MTWKALTLLACLLFGAILVACGPDTPRIPEGAKEALDRFFGFTEYSLLSAQQATQVAGIDEILRSQGVTPSGPWVMDEAWCVTTNPVIEREISFYLGPNEEDWEGHPMSPAVWSANVLLVVRRGNHWTAGPVWDYFIHDEFVGSAAVSREITAVLRALGCRQSPTE